MPVDVKETATQEELLEQFQTRYNNLISENQEMAKKIKDNVEEVISKADPASFSILVIDDDMNAQ